MISKHLIQTPKGFPQQPEAFSNNSLIISTAIGFLYHAAMSEENVKTRKIMLANLMKIQSKKAFLQNAAGKLILKCAFRLIEHIKGITINGPHSFSVLSEIVKKIPIQVIIFKDNKIKRMYPQQPELRRMRIALNESTTTYLPTQNNPTQIKRLDFIKSPRKLFKLNYQCTVCFQYKTRNRFHSKCKRSGV